MSTFSHATMVLRLYLLVKRLVKPSAADRVKGKIGQVISWDKKADCYTVKFEDESLEPVVVRRVDVRVVFDLDKYIGAQGNYMTEKSGINHILGYHIENEMYALHETNQSR